MEHPVSSHVLEILKTLPRVKGSPWVLPMPTDEKEAMPYHQLRRCWDRLRTAAELQDVHLHDLRHTVGTMGGQSGANAFMVRDLLRHRTVAMTNRYANRDNDPLRELSDKVSGRIAAALGGLNVVAEGNADHLEEQIDSTANGSTGSMKKTSHTKNRP